MIVEEKERGESIPHKPDCIYWTLEKERKNKRFTCDKPNQLRNREELTERKAQKRTRFGGETAKK